jgi:enoyl-CoA hydratase/carnithine racemase
MNYKDILFDVSDGVALVTLNRPAAMNTWTAVMAEELTDAMYRCNDDDSIRVVVLTGAGDRAFCAGADLGRGGGTFGGRDADGPIDRRPARPPIYPFQISKPVIAALNGHAVGVGITYPMLADVRIVAENAKIAFAFVRRGVLPELASHVTLTRVVGLSRAAELLLSGKTISGTEAAAMGLASRALPQAEVLPAAMEMARDIASNTAPASVAVTKQFLWEGLTASVPEMMRREGAIFAWLGNQADAREGVLSFVEKRQPHWTLTPSDVPKELIR